MVCRGDWGFTRLRPNLNTHEDLPGDRATFFYALWFCRV